MLPHTKIIRTVPVLFGEGQQSAEHPEVGHGNGNTDRNTMGGRHERG